MKNIMKLACVIGLAGVTLAANAQVYTFISEVTDGDIPKETDGIAPRGFTIDTTDVDGAFNQMEGTLNTNSFRVYLNIEGAPATYSGSYYITLTAPAQDGNLLTATILNRPGMGEVTGGYPDNGLNITLFDGVDPNDSSITDIHWYRNDSLYTVNSVGQVTGTYKSDGRSISADDEHADLYVTAARDSSMAIFQGINPNGEWTLAVLDMTDVGIGTLKSWGLDFTPIPEPSQYAMVVGAGLMAFGFYRNRMRKTA